MVTSKPMEYDDQVDWLAVATFGCALTPHRPHKPTQALPTPLVDHDSEWQDTVISPRDDGADVWTPAGAWFESRLALLLLVLVAALGSALTYIPR